MDRGLIVQAQAGDRDAFARIVTSSIARLDAAARLITRDPERAKDAVQDTLARAWRYLPGLRDPERFDAWLHRILLRACVDELRRRRAFVELDVNDVRVPVVGDFSTELANRDALDRGFQRLAVEQRAVIVLHFYVGLSLAEVAESLGVPPGTARSRLHRAVQTLRAAIDADTRATAESLQGRPA